jgi:TRAP-type C4-dicarboxylate transport system permease small subunit
MKVVPENLHAGAGPCPGSGEGAAASAYRGIRSINRVLDRAAYGAIALTAILFFCVVLGSVLMRYGWRLPILGSVELSRLLFVWSCFLAAALAYRRRAHVGLSLVLTRLGLSWQKRVEAFSLVLVLCFAGVIFFYSSQVVALLWFTRFSILDISQGWLYLPVPIACLFLGCYTLEWLMRSLLEWRN